MAWVLLEITPPREVMTSPKAMEQIFAAMHAIKSSKPKFWKKWWIGKVYNWMSFELVGRAGSIHFYVRVPEEFRNLVESSVYAQYPEAEIIVVPEEEDYVHQFALSLPNRTYDLWGTDFVLDKENAYPIRTYPHFEESVEEKRIDPIAGITEIMSQLKKSEAIWLQFLIRPARDAWAKKGEELINELLGEKKESKSLLGGADKAIDELLVFLKNIFTAPFEEPTWSEEQKEEKKKDKAVLSPGKKNILEEVERKISKTGFESVLRFVYIDRHDSFTRSNVAGVAGAIHQFNAPLMNSFVPNKKSITKAKQPFKALKTMRRKRKLYAYYQARIFPPQFSILNTEELATLYHFPITVVKSPTLRRVSSRRGGAPLDLPI